MSFISAVVTFFVTLVIVAPITWVVSSKAINKSNDEKIGNANERAREIIDEALKAAETKKKEALLEVKEESLKTKNELEKETKERRAEIQKYEKRVLSKEETLDRKIEAVEKRDLGITRKEEELGKQRQKVDELEKKRQHTYQRHDPSTGLTIVKVDESKLDEETRDGLAVAPLGSSYLVSQGDPVVAVGSPVGYSNSIAYGVVTSVTNKISALDNEYNLLTTDILGSTDGSGILVNLDGEIVGIIAQSYSAKGNNVVTGIAISQIKKLIENLSNNVSRAYIGIRGQDVTEELSDKTGIPKGVLISRVADDSPAMMAGMKEYDVIVKVGEHKVETIKQYHEQLGKYSTGDVVTVTAMRKGAEGYAEMTFDVTMGEV